MTEIRKILIVFGTRPEAIKMSQIIEVAKNDCRFDVKVCVTGQHREMLDQVLEVFSIKPDYNLKIMTKNQSLSRITCNILKGIDEVIKTYSPDLILVHGDTTTTFASTLAAFYQHVPVGHVEAGLRTGNLYSPWPEEANRKLTALISKFHFAPTISARQNLIKEGYPEKNIYVTGNSVIDALLAAKRKIEKPEFAESNFFKRYSFIDLSKKIILVTGHRRENFGRGIENICDALINLALLRSDVEIIYAVHMNPNVKKVVDDKLSSHPNIKLIPPQGYLEFIFLMQKSYLILTDSGGIQEEAPSLGKPVLLMRDTTERPEAVASGTVRLVGTSQKKIVKHTISLLDSKIDYENMSNAVNPYGDGTAAQQIIEIIAQNI